VQGGTTLKFEALKYRGESFGQQKRKRLNKDKQGRKEKRGKAASFLIVKNSDFLNMGGGGALREKKKRRNGIKRGRTLEGVI